MEYDLREFLTTTREKITPSLAAYLRAKAAEADARAALLKEQLEEQEYRNRNRDYRN